MASGDTLAIFGPEHAQPPASNYATEIVRNQRTVLAFDATTQETTYFTTILPRLYAGGGITAYVHWAADTAITGTIGWDVSFERVSDGSLDIDNDGFASAQTVTAATVPGTAGIESITNVAISNGANIDSIAVGDLFRLRVRRDVANDTAGGYAHLLGVELRET